MNRAIGLVVALNAEATALLGRGRWHHAEGHLFRHSRLTTHTHLFVARSGIGRKNALLASQWLINEGVGALGVSGISGGLNPDLKSGDLILADSVIQDNGGTCKQTWKGSPQFVDNAHAALIAKGIPAYRGLIVTVQNPVLSARSKQALFSKTNALAVDMESAAVARVAHDKGVPFFAVRAVCDPATRSIPDDLFDCINQKGQVRIFYLLRMLFLNPAIISELFRTKGELGAALTGLRRAWNRAVRDILPSLL